MPCYKPLKGWRSKEPNPSGKYSLTFKAREAWLENRLEIPCGQCIGCRLERSRRWAIRCVHEASLHEANSFVTLTYSPEFLPPDGSLNKRHFQLFMKRLRESISPQRVRYFHCGEYGESYGRPHYHACLFGYEPPDKKFLSSQNGNDLFTSEALDKLWELGKTFIGAVTFESAAYVARYIVKKITGPAAQRHYARLGLQPEYVTMSRRPGIAKPWYDKFKDDVYPRDYVVIRGKQMSPPKYYEGLLEKEDPDAHRHLKRMKAIKRNPSENTHERLRVREIVKQSSINQLKRKFEKT